ncbi:unnamed protein product [Hymenolepis diminuta]|uniref:Uncharacterized protein n=1 Tax=Hymenolepis diminuta TaxID=6216 RepID=A0A564XZ99_HYMDI|nr:unnamed protein product [Hymenolepis diminuta]
MQLAILFTKCVPTGALGLRARRPMRHRLHANNGCPHPVYQLNFLNLELISRCPITAVQVRKHVSNVAVHFCIPIGSFSECQNMEWEFSARNLMEQRSAQLSGDQIQPLASEENQYPDALFEVCSDS